MVRTKKLLRLSLSILPWLICAVLLGTLAIILLLPSIATHVASSEARKMGVEEHQFTVSMITHRRTVLSNTRIGLEGAGISASQVTVEYSLESLRKHRIDRIVVEGLRTTLGRDAEGQWLPIGLEDVIRNLHHTGETGTAPTIRRLELRDAELRFAGTDRELAVQINADIQPQPEPDHSMRKVNIAGTLEIPGTQAAVSGWFGQQDQNGELSITISRLNTEKITSIAEFFGIVLPEAVSQIHGEMSIDAEVAINQRQPKDIKISVRSLSTSRIGTTTLGTTSVDLAYSTEENMLTFSTGEVRVSHGEAFSTTLGVEGKVHLGEKPTVDAGFRVSDSQVMGKWRPGAFDFRLQADQETGTLVSSPITLDHLGGIAAADLRIHVKAPYSDPSLSFAGQIVLPRNVAKAMGMPFNLSTERLNARFAGNIANLAKSPLLKCTLDLEPQAVSTESGDISAGGTLAGNLTITGTFQKFEAVGNITLRDATATLPFGTLPLNEIRLDINAVNMASAQEGNWNCDSTGTLSASCPGFTAEDTIVIGACSGDLPWEWNWDEKPEGLSNISIHNGQFTLASACSRSVQIKPTILTVNSEQEVIAIAGKTNTTDGSTRLQLDGRIPISSPEFPQISIKATVPELENAGWLRALLHDELGITFDTLSGTIEATGTLQRDAGTEKWQGSADVVLSDVDLSMPSPPVTTTGLSGCLQFDDLLALSTQPHQNIVFDTALIGNMPIDGGSVSLRLEDSKKIFIEKGEVAWCGGTLTTHAFLLNPTDLDLDVVLYAANIQLGQLFALQTTVKGSAEATLYGRLPLHYKKGRLQFEEGFLYAVPGTKGYLRISNPEIITRNLPANDPRREQLAAALRDLELEIFRIDLSGDSRMTKMAIQIVGRSATDPTLPPVKLNTNVEANINDVIDLGKTFHKLNRLRQ